jgi:hypothetical protein
MPNDRMRRWLLDFLDEHVFNPILTTSPGRVDRREALEDAQARADWLRRRYYERCPTAAAVRAQFLTDVGETSNRLDRELDRLGLPTLPGARAQFLALCDQLGVGVAETGLRT